VLERSRVSAVAIRVKGGGEVRTQLQAAVVLIILVWIAFYIATSFEKEESLSPGCICRCINEERK